MDRCIKRREIHASQKDHPKLFGQKKKLKKRKPNKHQDHNHLRVSITGEVNNLVDDGIVLDQVHVGQAGIFEQLDVETTSLPDVVSVNHRIIRNG